MKQRWNIALVAVNTEPFVKIAQENYKDLSLDYLVGKHAIPHVTLGQFYADDAELKVICSEVKRRNLQPVQPEITGFSAIERAHEKGIWWLELAVTRTDPLIALYKAVLDILVDQNIPVVSQTGESYRPHITLTRIAASTISVNLTVLSESPFQSEFVLALGLSDEVGQFQRIIEVF